MHKGHGAINNSVPFLMAPGHGLCGLRILRGLGQVSFLQIQSENTAFSMALEDQGAWAITLSAERPQPSSGIFFFGDFSSLTWYTMKAITKICACSVRACFVFFKICP